MPRHQARVMTLQMLYQWEIGKTSIDDVLQTFFAATEPDAVDRQREFATELFRGTIEHVAALDQLIADHAEHWRVSRMPVMDRLVLRLAVYELSRARETPPKVVIDEAIELAKEFCGDESAAFINGVLDGIKRTLETTPA